MDYSEHPDNLRMVASVERYKERFYAIHPDDAGSSTVSSPGNYSTDYKMFGDIIEPNVLNAWNLEATERYVQLYVDQLVQSGDPDNALELLEPVLSGFFEHVFLIGYMYAQSKVEG